MSSKPSCLRALSLLLCVCAVGCADPVSVEPIEPAPPVAPDPTPAGPGEAPGEPAAPEVEVHPLEGSARLPLSRQRVQEMEQTLARYQIVRNIWRTLDAGKRLPVGVRKHEAYAYVIHSGKAIGAWADDEEPDDSDRYAFYLWPRRPRAGRSLLYCVRSDGRANVAFLPTDEDEPVAPEPGAAFSGGDLSVASGSSAEDATANDGRYWWSYERFVDLLRRSNVAEESSPWTDAAFLRERADAAWHRIAASEGIADPGAAPDVRILTFDGMRRALIDSLPDAKSEGHHASLGLGVVAHYERADHTIQVCPETIDALSAVLFAPELYSTRTLDVVLTHEAAHAHDSPGWDLGALAQAAKGADAFLALRCTVEGHAQFVTARAVREDPELLRAFEEFELLMSQFPEPVGAGLRVHPSRGFVYRRGLRFFEQIHAQGGDAAVRRALKTPPRRLLSIDRPLVWMQHGDLPLDDRVERALAALERDCAGVLVDVERIPLMSKTASTGPPPPVSDDDVVDRFGIVGRDDGGAPALSASVAVLRTSEAAQAARADTLKRREKMPSSGPEAGPSVAVDARGETLIFLLADRREVSPELAAEWVQRALSAAQGAR